MTGWGCWRLRPRPARRRSTCRPRGFHRLETLPATVPSTQPARSRQAVSGLLAAREWRWALGAQPGKGSDYDECLPVRRLRASGQPSVSAPARPRAHDRRKHAQLLASPFSPSRRRFGTEKSTPGRVRADYAWPPSKWPRAWSGAESLQQRTRGRNDPGTSASPPGKRFFNGARANKSVGTSHPLHVAASVLSRSRAVARSLKNYLAPARTWMGFTNTLTRETPGLNRGPRRPQDNAAPADLVSQGLGYSACADPGLAIFQRRGHRIARLLGVDRPTPPAERRLAATGGLARVVAASLSLPVGLQACWSTPPFEWPGRAPQKFRRDSVGPAEVLRCIAYSCPPGGCSRGRAPYRQPSERRPHSPACRALEAASGGPGCRRGRPLAESWRLNRTGSEHG